MLEFQEFHYGKIHERNFCFRHFRVYGMFKILLTFQKFFLIYVLIYTCKNKIKLWFPTVKKHFLEIIIMQVELYERIDKKLLDNMVATCNLGFHATWDVTSFIYSTMCELPLDPPLIGHWDHR